MRPPSSSRPPKASVYAVTIHCRSASLMPRSRWADGSAMFTIDASSTTISWATPITSSASHRLWSGLDDSVDAGASGTELDETVTSFSWLWVKTAWDASRNSRIRNRVPPRAEVQLTAKPTRERSGEKGAVAVQGWLAPQVRIEDGGVRADLAAADQVDQGRHRLPLVHRVGDHPLRAGGQPHRVHSGLIRDAVGAGVVALVQLHGQLDARVEADRGG